uniref:PLAT domain-containing protein n=1 Tax=Branchiostoma floridae TaxID=7739 RepID=C3XVB2_BRAFL|eukprot:XP_002612029.1 hypothetical protein BRAFLDRAFT_87002 [Branchiostoma floridae]
MDRNLFSWNGSTFGQNITTPIISFSLGSQDLDNCSMQMDLSIPIAFGFTDEPRRQRRALDGSGFGGTQLQDSGTNVGRRNNMTMAYHAYDVPAATTVVVMHLSWWDHAATFRIFFRHDALPTEEMYDDMETVMEEDVVLAWHRETGSSRTWVPNIGRRRGKLYVGIQTTGSNILQHTAPSAGEYKLRASTVNCMSWEDSPENWENDCGVILDLSTSAMKCNCSFPRPKAVIGGSVHFPPNSIDFDKIFGNPESLTENDKVFYVVIGEWVIYLLLIIFLNVDFQRLREKMRNESPKKKIQLEQLSVLPPDRMPASYLYHITINTGSMFAAGTSARIGFQLFGSKLKTAVKMLNPGGESLLRGGSYDFIMPVKQPLGHLELLHIWHDNTGGGDAASWFLREVIIKDMQTDRTSQFVCYDWLSDVRGDCQVQKALHAATREQMQSFNTLFRENTNALFYDQHMWTSPVVSPKGSSFSKAERLSCCWAVVNAMMVASAMWYRDEDDDSITNIVYNLGFIRFTLQELYVGLVTTVVVTPVAMAPLLLFRKEIPGSITAPGVRRSNSGKRLSRWPKYVAWVIVVVSSVVSSFFVIMYSLDWGREKSEAWLKAFFLSFCLSSVVAETGQLLILALLTAWICNPTPSSKQRKYEIKTDQLHLHLLDRKASEKVHPPGVASVLRMKRKNNQRRRFFFVLQEYILLFLFVAVLFFISQQDKDPFAFHASRTLSTTLTEDFDSITTPEEFWAWTEKILLPTLYPSFWYNGWKMKYLDRQFPLHTEAFRIGPPRLTQIREAADTMQQDNAQNGWIVAVTNDGLSCWQFNATSTMAYGSDCVSEYSMELPTALSKATSTLSDLQRNNWIDQYTKWLVLEMSFYYPSRKLFSSLRMVVQRNNVGHLSTSAVVGTHRVFQYENTSDYGVMIAHILFIFFFLATFIMEVVNIEGEGMRFFLSVWNLISFVSIVGSAVVICAFGIRYHFASEALKMIVEVTGELGIDHFVDFESTFWWDEAFKIVLAILVFVNTLKMLRVVRFNKTIAKFLALPGAMKNDLIGFSVTSAIVFMAFISSGEEILSDLDSNLRMIEESLDDTLDVACSICPDAEDTSDGTSFNRKDQRVALSLLSKKPSKDTYETANEAAPQASTSVMSLVYEEAQSVLRTHEDDAAKLNEVQNETRRRAQAIVQRKLAAKRRIKQARHGGERLASIAESAEVLLEQHADDEERLERQYQNNRRQFENKLQQKLTARRKQKDKEKK